MSKVLKQGKFIVIALMLLLFVALLPICASADGTVYINPDKLQGEPLNGTGWSYDGTTLELSAGYTFSINSSTSITCDVANYGTVVGGESGCDFAGNTLNCGTIDNAAFSGVLTNSGKITDSQFNYGTTMTNTESGVIEGVESRCIIKCAFENYGTIKKCIVTDVIYNFGTLDDADCFVISVINNYPGAMLKNSELAGEFYNDGDVETTVVNVEFTNTTTGHIKSGTFNEAVVNEGTISGGIFNDKVVNKEECVIKGGTFNRSLVNGTYKGSVENHGIISGGDFNCTVTNYGECESGNYYNSVTNLGVLSGGNYYDTVTNEGAISNGTFAAGVVNHKTVIGGTFKQLLANRGTVSGCNAVAANYDSASTSYVVYGEATLGSDIILSDGDSMTIPEGAKLIIPNGITLNAVKGTLSIEGDIEVQNGGALITTAIQEESHNWAEIIGRYNKNTVTEADRETLSNAIAKIDELLASNELDDDTRALLEKVKAGANELIAYLDEVKDAPVTDGEKEPPKTGDERNFGLLFAIMLISATVMVFTYEKKKN